MVFLWEKYNWSLNSSFHCFSVSNWGMRFLRKQNSFGSYFISNALRYLNTFFRRLQTFYIICQKIEIWFTIKLFFYYVDDYYLIWNVFRIILYCSTFIRENKRFDKNIVCFVNIFLFWWKLKVHSLCDEILKKFKKFEVVKTLDIYEKLPGKLVTANKNK